MKKIYLAGPLFSVAETNFNAKLAHFLVENGYEVFLPQVECKNKTGREIFETCVKGIESSDMILAVLDGADADSGTCWECGYSFAKGKPVIGLRTDFRNSGDTRGFNAMIYYSAASVMEGPDDHHQKILEQIKKITR